MQLIGDAFENAFLDSDLLAQLGKLASMQNQFAEERRHLDDRALAREEAAKARKEIESAHLDNSGNGNGVGRVRRNPDRAQRGDDPGALRRVKSHDAMGGEEELVLGVGMLGNAMAVREIGGDGGEFGDAAALRIAQDALALMRHLLSQ